MRSLWTIRILFLSLCIVAGFEVSQVEPDWIAGGVWGCMIGFGLGALCVALDEMLKGFSLRAFSAVTFGLALGTLVAGLLDHSALFPEIDSPLRRVVRLGLFLSFGYLGMILAMRSNKEDFSLIIPYVRFASQSKPENLLLLDTSVIIDGRIADLLEANFIDGTLVVPRFVLHELTLSSAPADAADWTCWPASATANAAKSKSTRPISRKKPRSMPNWSVWPAPWAPSSTPMITTSAKWPNCNPSFTSTSTSLPTP
jgi:hypothetical protein